MSSRQLDRSILRIAVPALGALAIDPLLTLVDTAYVARLGVVELAALGVDTAILGFAFFAFNFLAYALTPLVAQSLGRGDRDLARRWVGDALFLAIAIGLVVVVVVEALTPWFVGLMGASGEVADQAVAYLRVRAIAAPAVLIVTVGHGAFRGHHDTRTPLVVALVVNGINVVLAPILIFGLDWGVRGAALATVVAQVVGAVWFLRLLSGRDMARRPGRIRESLPTLGVLGRSGVLITVRTGILLFAFAVAARAATRIGTEEIAAYQVVLQVWLISAMVADSLAIAGQAMVGSAAGSADGDGVRALSGRLAVMGLIVGMAIGALLVLGRPVFGMLTQSAEVEALVSSALLVVAAMMPLGALVFVADGIFFGLMALGAIVYSTAAGALLAIAAILGTSLGESLDGIWWAVALLLVGRAVVFVAGYRRAVSTALARS